MNDSAARTRLQPNSKVDKGARRRIRLFVMIVLCVVIWALMNVIQQADVVQGKLARLTVLEEKLSETIARNEKLQLEITRLNDPEYIEQKARKDYQMVKDGETLFTEPESAE